MDGRLRSAGRAGACSSRESADMEREDQFDRRLVIHVRMLVVNLCMSSLSCGLKVSWHRHCIHELQHSDSGCHLTRRHLRHPSLYC
jgi:hypothetical protein